MRVAALALMAALSSALVQCSDAPSSSNAAPTATPQPDYRLPALGMLRSEASNILKARGTPWQGDPTGNRYEFNLAGNDTMVQLMYSKDSRGNQRVMQINVEAITAGGGPDLSPIQVDEAKREVLPSDIIVLKSSQVSEAVRADASGNQANEDVAFLGSHSLAKILHEDAYYSAGKHTGICPYSDPGTIEEYRETGDNGLERIGFFATYLDKCGYKILD